MEAPYQTTGNTSILTTVDTTKQINVSITSQLVYLIVSIKDF